MVEIQVYREIKTPSFASRRHDKVFIDGTWTHTRVYRPDGTVEVFRTVYRLEQLRRERGNRNFHNGVEK